MRLTVVLLYGSHSVASLSKLDVSLQKLVNAVSKPIIKCEFPSSSEFEKKTRTNARHRIERNYPDLETSYDISNFKYKYET